MKPVLLFATLILLLISCKNAEKTKIEAIRIDPKTLPKSIHYKGAIDTAVKYTDTDGEHIIITSEGDTYEKNYEGDRLNGIYLYAYCYKLSGGKWKLSWQMQDDTGECEEDVSGGYLPKTFAVTDLNNDGQAEVWLMYQLACRGGVDPSAMKVIMHQGNQKYAMRGETRIVMGGKEYAGGEYKFDEAFKKGPEAFRQQAKGLWKDNLVETVGSAQ